MLARIRALPWRLIAPWALFVLTLGAAITFGLLWQKGEAVEADRDEVRDLGIEFVTALTNFSAETIEEDAARIKSFAVGDFKEEAETFFGEEAIQAIIEAEAVSTGEIERLFVQDVEGDQASIFAVVSETIANSALEEPQTDTLRVEVMMIETSSGWKVSEVNIFQAPGGGLLPG